MYCPKCGKENADSVVFCGTCGAQLQQGQSAASVSQSNPGFKKVNVWLTVLLTFVTFGFYLPYWFITRSGAANRMQSSKKLNKWPFYIVVVLYIISLLASFASGFMEVDSGADDPTVIMFNIISGVMNLIGGIILIVQAFKLRAIFNDHFAAKGEKFSGIWTFLGNIWYFQYKVNKLFY